MKLNKKYSYWVILLFLVISTTNSTAKTTNESLEWKIKVGDSRTYTYSKLLDLKDIDENGDPESKIYSVAKEDGTKENVTLKKGIKYTINITTLEYSATFRLIFGDIVSTVMSDGKGFFSSIYYLYIIKTLDNKSYWERLASNMTIQHSDTSNYTVEGNIFVKHMLVYLTNGDKVEFISNYNWKTGWLTYLYEKTSNDTHTIKEEEITSGSSNIGITSIEITTIFVGLTIIAIAISRKRKRTKISEKNLLNR